MLDVNGTLTGKFAAVDSTSALFEFIADYNTSDQVWLAIESLDLLPTMEESSVPPTGNEIALATYIQNAMDGGASASVIDAILALPTPEAINKAIDSLSPEPIASAIGAAKQNVSAQHLNVTSRLGIHHRGHGHAYGKNKFTAGLTSDYYPVFYANQTQASTPLNSFWVKAIYLNAENDSDNSFGFTTDTQGVSIGRDYLNGNLLYGVSGGYSQLDIDFDNVVSEGDIDTLNLSLYGSYAPGAYYLDTVLSYSRHNYDMARYIPAVGETALADYSANEYSVYLKGGYPIQLNNFLFTPVASVQYSYLKQDSFTETGSSAALFVDETDSNSFITGLGVEIEKSFDYGQWKLLPHLSLIWNHEFCDTADKVKAGFADFGGSYGTFEIEGYDAGSETYNAQLGITAYKGNSFSLFLNYDLGIKEDYISNSVTGGLKFYF
jgi:outer membrane autotransporter protein